MNELETISGEEESTLKQMNMYRIFYTLLTIIAIIVLIILLDTNRCLFKNIISSLLFLWLKQQPDHL